MTIVAPSALVLVLFVLDAVFGLGVCSADALGVLPEVL